MTQRMDQEKSCCVPICKRPRSPGTPLHGFPNPKTESDRFRAWVYAVGGNIYALQDDYIYAHRRICRHHFKTLFRLGHNRLAKTAVPTLNLNVGEKLSVHSYSSRIVHNEDIDLTTTSGPEGWCYSNDSR